MGDHILVIDEGTTSTRAMLFTPDGACVASEAAALTQHYPAPGRVEHDAAEIWRKTLRVTAAMVAQAGGAERIAAIGITNQRETVVFWDRTTGKPLGPAIVWQDRRTAAACRALRDAGEEPAVQARTGLLLDPYFSASKIGWAMREWPEVAAAGSDLAVGTIESWLVWNLTGGLHLTDATNASRTALMDLTAGRWDAGLADLFGAPLTALPEIVDCAGRFGTTKRVRPGHPDLRNGRRPAGGKHRTGLPRHRRDQGDLRHRCVRADPCGGSGADVAHTACSRPWRGSSAASGTMRWRVRCSSRAA